jgi:pSer/pThr/pTyr-binding forkhead associated (FHA) protein
VVEDLRSTNGTFVNGDRVSGRRVLRGGDVVTIGQTQLEYRAGE